MLDGKAALITGSGQGIGLEIATEFAKAGAKVMLNDINEETLNESIKELTNQGLTVDGVVANVAKEEDVKNMQEKAKKQFGKINILVNNAGTTGSGIPLQEMPTAEWDRVIEVDLKSVFLNSKYFIPLMETEAVGNIYSIYQKKPL